MFCNSNGIRISGPKLGRPKKDEVVDKHQEYVDSGIRNAVEGKFGEGKTSYGLRKIKARLKETSETIINLAFWVMNLNKRLRLLLLFLLFPQKNRKTEHEFYIEIRVRLTKTKYGGFKYARISSVN